jgi:PST family polysaccharide transporter
VRAEREPTVRQLRSVFTIQILVGTALLAIIWSASPWLAQIFRLPPHGAGLFHLVALEMVILPFGCIESALLSRRLAFGRLAWVNLVGRFVYQGTAVALALEGLSYWSFGWAGLASVVAQTALLTVFFRWRIGFGWDRVFLRECIKFGGAFQLSGLTSLARDNIITFLGGPLFGPSAVGLLSWSSRLAEVCSQDFTWVCTSVSFPSLSRLRFNPDLFGKFITRLLRYLNIATLLSLSVVAGLLPQIVHLVYGDKWLAAVPLFYWFAIRMLAANYTTVLDLGLKAEGRAGKSLFILSAWTACEWALAVPTAALMGYSGIAVSYSVGAWVAAVWLYRENIRFTRINLLRTAGSATVAAAMTFLFLLLTRKMVETLAGLVVTAVVGVAIYVTVLALCEGPILLRELRADLRRLIPKDPALISRSAAKQIAATTVINGPSA